MMASRVVGAGWPEDAPSKFLLTGLLNAVLSTMSAPSSRRLDEGNGDLTASLVVVSPSIASLEMCVRAIVDVPECSKEVSYAISLLKDSYAFSWSSL